MCREQSWVAFAAVSCHTVWLLKAFATKFTGKAQGSCRLCMLASVPVQRGLLTASEPTYLTPAARDRKKPWSTFTSLEVLLPTSWLPDTSSLLGPWHSLQGLLSCVDSSVDDKVAASAERASAEFTDVVPGVCRHTRNIQSSSGFSLPSPTEGEY